MRAFPCIPFDSHANHDLSCSPLLSSLSLSLASSGEAKGAPAVVGVGAPKIVCHSVRQSEGDGRDKGAGDLAMLGAAKMEGRRQDRRLVGRAEQWNYVRSYEQRVTFRGK